MLPPGGKVVVTVEFVTRNPKLIKYTTRVFGGSF
jgi:hypothetical protein